MCELDWKYQSMIDTFSRMKNITVGYIYFNLLKPQVYTSMMNFHYHLQKTSNHLR